MADRGPDPISSLAQGVYPALQKQLAEFTAPDNSSGSFSSGLSSGLIGIAYSGGLDSTVLLHACRMLLGGERLVAFHVHHGLQAAADDFAGHAVGKCARWGIRLELLKLNASPPPGASVEAWAGEQRYRVIAAKAREIGVLATLTAHHEDDQAETVMLRLLRGTGSRGLTGIAPELLREGHRFMRPLLAVSRAEIESYEATQVLGWIEDPSNQSQRFARNAIRHRLMPLLEELAPGAARRISAAARHWRDADQLMRDYLVADLQALVQVIAQTPRLEVFDCQQARELSRARVAEVLRFWIKTLGHEAASEARFEQIQNLVYNLDSPYGEVEHGSLLLIKYRHDLFAIEQGAAMLERIAQVRCEVYAERSPEDYGQINIREGDQSAADQLVRTPIGRLVLSEIGNAAGRTAGATANVAANAAATEEDAEPMPDDRHTLYLPDGRMRIVNYSTGTAPFRARGQNHERSLKDNMQTAGIPRWLRPLLPVLSVEGQLLWVGGLGASADSAADLAGVDAGSGSGPMHAQASSSKTGSKAASNAASNAAAKATTKAAAKTKTRGKTPAGEPPAKFNGSKVRVQWHWGQEKSSLALPEHLLTDWLLRKSGL